MALQQQPSAYFNEASWGEALLSKPKASKHTEKKGRRYPRGTYKEIVDDSAPYWGNNERQEITTFP